MKIFITGVAGFLGSHLADLMIANGHTVAGNDNMIGGYVDNVPQDVEFHQVDCCDSDKYEFYKGGGNCHHFWLRRIYKTSLRNAKQNINDSQLISYTKARSEGFTAEKNDNLVARPPKRMRNEGFLKPR